MAAYVSAQKIYRSSGRNLFITGAIVCLACLRLLAAIMATVEMLRLGLWEPFIDRPYSPPRPYLGTLKMCRCSSQLASHSWRG
ncbi:hypothetical protein DFH06DRAFT_1484372 [Mycena polygramma]|nr:hypothetical protein DFH06DRAFT_1484372 [Mycena polygramma]